MELLEARGTFLGGCEQKKETKALPSGRLPGRNQSGYGCPTQQVGWAEDSANSLESRGTEKAFKRKKTPSKSLFRVYQVTLTPRQMAKRAFDFVKGGWG